ALLRFGTSGGPELAALVRFGPWSPPTCGAGRPGEDPGSRSLTPEWAHGILESTTHGDPAPGSFLLDLAYPASRIPALVASTATLALIPEDKIAEVRDRTDIVEVIGQFVTLKRAGASHKGLCPFHAEKTPSFNVSGIKQMFHCFGCGKSGDVIAF